MRRFYLILCIVALAALALQAKKTVVPPATAWSVSSLLGHRYEADIDTSMINYSHTAIPSAISDAWVTTGNYGAPGYQMIFLDRTAMSDFFFRDAVTPWIPTIEKHKFYNSRIPVTFVGYTAGGGRDNGQEHLSVDFSGNINRKAQVGAMLSYIYSKGSYDYQAAKGLSWGVSGSYLGDRYEFQGYYKHYNNVNKENGGITDPLYITDPAQLQGGITSIAPKSIPTVLKNAHTRVMGDDLWINNRYKVGYWHEEAVNDTTVNRTYIPFTAFVHTLRYRSSHHGFTETSSAEIADFFDNTYLYPNETRDRTGYWCVANTLAIELLEGFHKYAKFGLAAYATHQARRYTQTPDTLDRSNPDLALTPMPEGISIKEAETQQLLHVGAQISKRKGSILNYDATAEFGLVGPVAGDVKLEGNVSTRFKLFGDTVTITANGYFRNEEAPYLTKNYISNHFVWQNDFGKERRYRVGGVLDIAHIGAKVEVGVENLQNHIYFGQDGLPHQHGSNVQVFSARLSHHLKLGIMHWENRITYQTSSDDNIIPLPKLAIYSNLYILCRIAALKMQLGVDCDYYTRYYAPIYQPATCSFANQHTTMVGNYPFMTFYANMKLSKVKLYVQYSHVNQGWFGTNYFVMPNYPLNPRRFQIGLSVDFAN